MLSINVFIHAQKTSNLYVIFFCIFSIAAVAMDSYEITYLQPHEVEVDADVNAMDGGETRVPLPEPPARLYIGRAGREHWMTSERRWLRQLVLNWRCLPIPSILRRLFGSEYGMYENAESLFCTMRDSHQFGFTHLELAYLWTLLCNRRRCEVAAFNSRRTVRVIRRGEAVNVFGGSANNNFFQNIFSFSAIYSQIFLQASSAGLQIRASLSLIYPRPSSDPLVVYQRIESDEVIILQMNPFRERRWASIQLSVDWIAQQTRADAQTITIEHYIIRRE